MSIHPDIQSVLAGERRWCVVTGDCLDVLKTLPEKCADAVVTDPPYGVNFKGKRTKNTASLVNTGYSNLADDPEIVATVAVPAIHICIEKFGRAAVMPGVRNMYRYPEPADVGCVFNPAGAGSGRWGFVCYHPVLFYGKCPFLAAGMGSRPNSIKDAAAGEKVEGHPCPKPLRWMQWLVERTSTPDSLVLDPFTGSGTTGVAAIKTGRRFIGIEIDDKYAEIARGRIAKAEAEVAGRLVPA